MFSDASDFHWGSCFTQVPEEEFRSGVALQNMSHEPLAFLSGSFKGSQLGWATVDKEGFAIVNTFAGWNTCFGVGFISLRVIAISRTFSTPKRA